jgi:hypothetical protein
MSNDLTKTCTGVSFIIYISKGALTRLTIVQSTPESSIIPFLYRLFLTLSLSLSLSALCTRNKIWKAALVEQLKNTSLALMRFMFFLHSPIENEENESKVQDE